MLSTLSILSTHKHEHLAASRQAAVFQLQIGYSAPMETEFDRGFIPVFFQVQRKPADVSPNQASVFSIQDFYH
ncbi:MAG: hypothetical protein WDM80_16375 [Limisphaerales bacterium]